MTTEAQKAYMRDYMKKRRAAGLDSSRLPTGERPRRHARTLTPPAPLSGTKLASALSAYSRSIGALERSAYLDALVLGKRPAQEMTPLPSPRGADLMTEAQRRVKYRAELKPLVETVEALYDDLPDLVSLQDVLDRLDPVLAAPVIAASLHSRAPLAVSKVLKRLGAQPRDAGNCQDGTKVRLYILRRAERYAGMKGRKLFAEYERIKTEQQSKIINRKKKLLHAQPPSLPGSSRKSAQPAHMERSTTPSA
jgi:hypothetical protein